MMIVKLAMTRRADEMGGLLNELGQILAQKE